jgi:ATP-dependent RNA helicase RhlE
MNFSELRLIEPIVRAAADQGYETPTPIQAKAIPVVLSGHDVLGCAQTGTGKTAAFAMPMLQLLAAGKRPKTPEPQKKQGRRGGRRPHTPCMPRALVLSPTRELASQIFESFCTYGNNLRLRHVVIFGGVSQAGQMRAMRGGADVIVATPGRLLDLMRQGHIDMRAIETLVLDEADHMLDMGFIPDIRRIIEKLPKKRQTLFFSATMPRDIRKLAEEILTEPVSIEVDRVASTVESIEQNVYMIAHKVKHVLLERLIRRHSMSRTLVFTRTKRGADKLVQRLQSCGLEAGAIHGNKSQNARTLALAGFKSGKMPVLVATDIAARGIDVANVSHVVNYDIPHVSETYVHRIGRTARAGANGIAVSFCDRDERGSLRSIETLIDRQLQAVPVDRDLEDNQSHTRKAPQQRNNKRPQRSGSKQNNRRATFEGRTFDGREIEGHESQGRRPKRTSAQNKESGSRKTEPSRHRGKGNAARSDKPYWQSKQESEAGKPGKYRPKNRSAAPQASRSQSSHSKNDRPHDAEGTQSKKRKPRVSGGKKPWSPKSTDSDRQQSGGENARPKQHKSGKFNGSKSKPRTGVKWQSKSKSAGKPGAHKKKRAKQTAS